ncbi:MAG: hypothetical protein ABIS86_13525 [Streptosporangiaceae bacterium]
MPNVLPAWVGELTDPRRAEDLAGLADRLVPLAEHSIDVSKRLQEQLSELNAPFESEALQAMVDALHTRAAQAYTEVTEEIGNSGRARVERILTRAGSRPELRERLAAEVFPELAAEQRKIAEQIGDRTAKAISDTVMTLLDQSTELATAVSTLIHQVLPAAQEGLTLAGRISNLSGRVRTAGHGDIPADLLREAAETAGAYDETVARLEMEWSVLGARTATVRAAMSGARESAFSQITAQMTAAMEDLAPGHVKALNVAEAKGMALVAEAIGR